MAKASIDKILEEVAAGKVRPVYLVSGDVVLAEPKARRLAEELARRSGCEVERHGRPPQLAGILQDLKTYSLFGSGKVTMAVDTAVLADKSAAAELIDQAAEALPVEDPAMELEKKQRAGAARLMQALQVFGLDVAGGLPADLVASLPEWALKGGRALRKKRPRGRSAKEVKVLEEGLPDLLAAARVTGLQGIAEGDVAELGEVVQKGLPEGHSLVLVEHSVAADHPVVKTLKGLGAVVEAGTVQAVRGEWQGLESLAAELGNETSVAIAADALRELARRTLRQTGDWNRRRVDGESTARFAAEYRKLVSLAGGGEITRQHVEEAVEDRGEEDVWKILDALGDGRGGEALSRYRRLLAAADDSYTARLTFFGLLASFCRQVSAVAGMARLCKVPAGVRSYNEFKSRWAPALQGDLPGDGSPAGFKNPIAGLHPFRLHRAYLTASSFDRGEIARLPWWILETEMRMKGESSEPDVAVSMLMARIAAAVRRPESQARQ